MQAEQVAQKLVATAQVIAAAKADATDSEVNLQEAFDAVIASVVEKVEAEEIIGLGTTDFTADVIDGTIDESDLDADAQAALAAQIVQVSEIIDSAEDLDGTVGAFLAAGDLADAYSDGEGDNFNFAPSAINLAGPLEVSEDAGPGASLGDISVTDIDQPDGVDFVPVLGGIDADSFEIVDGELVFKEGVELNYEEKASYEVELTVTDDDGTEHGGKDYSETFTITLSNADDETTGSFEITGVAEIGGMLSVTNNTLADEDNTVDGSDETEFATVAYQWLRCGETVEGATASFSFLHQLFFAHKSALGEFEFNNLKPVAGLVN